LSFGDAEADATAPDGTVDDGPVSDSGERDATAEASADTGILTHPTDGGQDAVVHVNADSSVDADAEAAVDVGAQEHDACTACMNASVAGGGQGTCSGTVCTFSPGAGFDLTFECPANLTCVIECTAGCTGAFSGTSCTFECAANGCSAVICNASACNFNCSGSNACDLLVCDTTSCCVSCPPGGCSPSTDPCAPGGVGSCNVQSTPCP
jgi:hypothetical protein